MRVLLRLVAVVAALALVAVLVLLAAGGWRGKGRVAAAVEVQAPTPLVFAHLVQPELLPRWLGGLNRSEPLDRDGPKVGARSRETLGEGEDAFEVEVEITRYQPDQLLGLKISHPEFLTHGLYVVKDKGGGRTTLIYEGNTTYPHPVARLLSPVVTRLNQTKLEEDLLRLKTLLEAPVAPAEVAAQEAAAAAAATTTVPIDPEITPSDSAPAADAGQPVAPAEAPPAPQPVDAEPPAAGGPDSTGAQTATPEAPPGQPVPVPRPKEEQPVPEQKPPPPGPDAPAESAPTPAEASSPVEEEADPPEEEPPSQDPENAPPGEQ